MAKVQKTVKAAIAGLLSLVLVTSLTPAIAMAATIHTNADAKAAAKRVVGKTATVTEIDSDYEKGNLYYEVNLRKNNKKYELVFKAKNTKLVEYKWELRKKGYQQKYGKNLSKATIKKKAKRYIKKGTVTSAILTTDDGIRIYKVKMKDGTRRYTLEYNAKSGKLLEYEWKTATFSSASSKYIGVTKAKTIALKRVPGATVRTCKYEVDDGIPVYEVELIKGTTEYDITINAKTGKVIDFEMDSIYD